MDRLPSAYETDVGQSALVVADSSGRAEAELPCSVISVDTLFPALPVADSESSSSSSDESSSSSEVASSSDDGEESSSSDDDSRDGESPGRVDSAGADEGQQQAPVVALPPTEHRRMRLTVLAMHKRGELSDDERAYWLEQVAADSAYLLYCALKVYDVDGDYASLVDTVKAAQRIACRPDYVPRLVPASARRDEQLEAAAEQAERLADESKKKKKTTTTTTTTKPAKRQLDLFPPASALRVFVPPGHPLRAPDRRTELQLFAAMARSLAARKGIELEVLLSSSAAHATAVMTLAAGDCPPLSASNEEVSLLSAGSSASRTPDNNSDDDSDGDEARRAWVRPFLVGGVQAKLSEYRYAQNRKRRVHLDWELELFAGEQQRQATAAFFGRRLQQTTVYERFYVQFADYLSQDNRRAGTLALLSSDYYGAATVACTIAGDPRVLNTHDVCYVRAGASLRSSEPADLARLLGVWLAQRSPAAAHFADQLCAATDDSAIGGLLTDWLAGVVGRPVLIVLDGVAGEALSLRWLPACLPPGAKLLLVTWPGSQLAAELAASPSLPRFSLPALPANADCSTDEPVRRRIVDALRCSAHGYSLACLQRLLVDELPAEQIERGVAELLQAALVDPALAIACCRYALPGVGRGDGGDDDARERVLQRLAGSRASECVVERVRLALGLKRRDVVAEELRSHWTVARLWKTSWRTRRLLLAAVDEQTGGCAEQRAQLLESLCATSPSSLQADMRHIADQLTAGVRVNGVE